MTEHRLFAITHKTKGMIYALGESPTAAWENACMVCTGHAYPNTLAVFKRERRADGWRPKRVLVIQP